MTTMLDEELTREVPAEIPGKTPETPYGVTATGAPRRKPGPKPGSGPRKSSPPKAASGPGRKLGNQPDYRGAILGLIQIPAAGLAMVGRRNPAFLADSATLAVHGPNVADALHATAIENPAFAAVLDRVLSVGPYGALIAAVVPMVAQLAVNHRPAMAGVAGTLPPEELIRMASGG